MCVCLPLCLHLSPPLSRARAVERGALQRGSAAQHECTYHAYIESSNRTLHTPFSTYFHNPSRTYLSLPRSTMKPRGKCSTLKRKLLSYAHTDPILRTHCAHTASHSQHPVLTHPLSHTTTRTRSHTHTTHTSIRGTGHSGAIARAATASGPPPEAGPAPQTHAHTCAHTRRVSIECRGMWLLCWRVQTMRFVGGMITSDL